MKQVTIHSSGHGGEKFEVVSHGNGIAYDFRFGEAGSPMRNVFLQGDDAAIVRDHFDELEEMYSDEDTRELWLKAVDGYL